ncbi:hydroxyacylglutathione hydrolase [Spiribacter roseus]|uniref:Hydroxyacylglutathione hydrolase n=1 Tax=Spiribacter roseus TaxID=1855875 RepID=A0ABV3RYD7_9GAMM
MLEITPIPVLSDNYTWLIHHPQSTAAVVVDPGEAAPVAHALESLGLTLSAILITHHHGDHVAGIAGLRDDAIPVYGPADSDIPHLTQPLKHGDRITPGGLGVEFEVIAVPGHTLDHIAYLGDGSLFAGDALFAGGCGRMFEGTPAPMQGYLAKLRALPPATRVYCGHEYTQANLAFARAVEPENTALQARAERVHEQRQRGAITLPSTIGEERATNPFMRWDSDAVRRHAGEHAGRTPEGPADVFAILRDWKDNF